jgi:hypothetical protein
LLKAINWLHFDDGTLEILKAGDHEMAAGRRLLVATYPTKHFNYGVSQKIEGMRYTLHPE